MSEHNIREPYTFDRVVRIIFSIAGIVAAIVLLNQRWTRLKGRFIPVVLTLLEACLAFGVFLALFVPYFISETSAMADVVRKYATTQIDIPYISRSIHDFIRENVDFNTITRYLSKDQWGTLLKETLSSGWSFLSSSVAFVFGAVSWLIVVLYVIFIMIDYERLMLSFRQLVPQSHRHRVFHIFDDCKNAMNRYFRGQAVIASLVGIMFSIGFVIIGLPMGVVLGLFIGMLNMVPYLQLISLPITAVLCIVYTVSTGDSFWMIFWESMAVYVVVQCIQDLILTPKIMGKAMGLNPAIILLSLSVWGSLLGFMGLIIALPLTTLLLSYYDLYVLQRVRRKQLLSDLHAREKAPSRPTIND